MASVVNVLHVLSRMQRVMASTPFRRLVRFVPKSDSSKILLGEPVDENVDVGLTVRAGDQVVVQVWSGSSVLSHGERTESKDIIDRILSPLAQHEVGTIRCIGLNYKQHAAEVNMDLPTVPTVFMKPSTSLASPWPAPTIVPKSLRKMTVVTTNPSLSWLLAKIARMSQMPARWSIS